MLFPVLAAAAAYGTAVAGVDIVTRVLKKVAPEPIAPVVSGVCDVASAIVDPLDLAGRAESHHGVAGPEPVSGGLWGALTGEASRARAKAAAAERKAAVGDQKATQYAAEASTARAKGDRTRAEQAALKALHAERWARLSRDVAALARDKADMRLANRADALASLAQDPPGSVAQALNAASNPTEKSLIASLFDQINRPLHEPDYGYLADRMSEPNGVIDPVMAGSCCSACAKSGGSCGGKLVAPDELLDGRAHGSGDDGFSMFGNSGRVAGSDGDWLSFDEDEDDF